MLKNTRKPLFVGLMTSVVGVFFSAQTMAQPPAWAPAHGYHSKTYKQPHKQQYRHTTPQYANDYSTSGFDTDVIAPLIGAAVGGLVGSKIGGGKGKLAATAAGSVIGYVLGGKVRDYMDHRDRYETNNALEYSRNYDTVDWVNPDTQGHYSVMPVATYQNQQQICRDYVTNARIQGRTEKIHGTACRQSDGRWIAQN